MNVAFLYPLRFRFRFSYVFRGYRKASFFHLNFEISVNNLLADEIVQTEELGKKITLVFAMERLVENGANKFHEVLPKTKLPTFKKIGKSVLVQKNNKQHIVGVNRDKFIIQLNNFISKVVLLHHPQILFLLVFEFHLFGIPFLFLSFFQYVHFQRYRKYCSFFDNRLQVFDWFALLPFWLISFLFYQLHLLNINPLKNSSWMFLIDYTTWRLILAL